MGNLEEWLQQMQTFNEVDIAAVFSIYWLMTLQKALLSFWAYVRRSVVVAIYTVCMWGDQRTFVTNAEWIAWGMVWCHWLSVVQAFIYPDPRFRRIHGKR